MVISVPPAAPTDNQEPEEAMWRSCREIVPSAHYKGLLRSVQGDAVAAL